MVRENRLFMGNPGTGKSTLINCLIGENQSRAGLHWGGGLTQDYQRFEHNDVAYMDTPGLADETIVKEAADAITKALKESGTYKLFFMVRLQNGRLVSEDIVTLERVLDSIDAEDLNFKYTIVMNCVGAIQYQTLIKRGDEFKMIKTLVNRRHLTESFCFVPRIEALEERSDHIEALPQEVCTYIDNDAPVIRIEKHQVKRININDFFEETHEIKSELEKLRTQQAALLQALQEQEKRHEEMMRMERARQAAEIERLNGGPTEGRNRDAVLSPRSDYIAIAVTPATEPSKREYSTVCCQRKRAMSLGTTVVLLVIAVVVFLYR